MRITKTIEEFKATETYANLNDYQLQNIADDEEITAEINAFWPCELLVECSLENGKLYREHTKMRLVVDGEAEISINKWRNGSKKHHYVIYCPSIDNLKNVSRYALREIMAKMTEPNRIGVLNKKKIQAWVDYYMEVYAKAKAISEQNTDEKDAFLKSIEGLPVRWWNNGKQGEIVMNGLKFEFSLTESYVSKRIEVHYTANSELSTFLAMADNKYQPIKK